MTYDEFLNIPGSVLKDLETILILKDRYHMDITSEERELCEYIMTHTYTRTSNAIFS